MKRKIIRLSSAIFLVVLVSYYFYPEMKLPKNIPVDSIVVYKSKRQLLAYSNGKLLKTYKISLGKKPTGHKQIEGDKRTPEGVYYINAKNPESSYHKNLGISYPNKTDIETAREIGKLSGGDIKIHGLKNNLGFIGKFQRWYDWTAGCIALTNQEVDELYDATIIGTKIEIKP